MALIKDLKNLFQTEDLYEVLGVKRDANDADLRKAYRRKSLGTHPDRAPEENRVEATKQFQALGKVYAILSDVDRRADYDANGVVDDDAEAFLARERDWLAYWRRHYKTVTAADIESYRASYQKSDEELADLKEAYVRHTGDMEQVIDSIMCANALADENRFRLTIDEWIRDGIVDDYPAYGKEKASKRVRRRKRAQREATEAAKAAKELGMEDDGGASLEAAIGEKMKKREEEGEEFIAELAEKYAGDEKEPESASAETTTEPAEAPPPKKRGRGRPPKNRAPGEETTTKKPAPGSAKTRLRKRVRDEAAEEAEWTADGEKGTSAKASVTTRPRRAAKKEKYEEKPLDDEEEEEEEEEIPNEDDDDDDDAMEGLDEEEDEDDDDDDDDDDEPKPPPKRSPAKSKSKKPTPTGRKRGRPPKNRAPAAAAPAPASDDKDGEAADPPKKRGRGRPKKVK